MLERPEVLDIHERASQATGGNNNGVEGMMNLMVTLGRSLFTVIVTFVAVTVLDWRLVIILIGLAILQYIYFKRIIRLDKQEVWDKLAPVWRQVNYMERVTQDFDFAKDIRLFHRLRHGSMGNAMHLPGKGGRKISVAAYRISQKVVGFN